MIKSPLRYPGGKSRAVKNISKIIPEFEEYREPFLGGGSIYIYAKQMFPNKKFWINDIYFELFKFWEVAQKNIEELVENIYKWRNEYKVGRDLYNFLHNNLSTFNDIETATAFFIFNRITFSGTTLSGGYSESAFNGRFTENSIQKLYSFSHILSNTKITNLDYTYLLNEAGKNVFIFLDPPYYSARKSALYGKNGDLHKYFDHEKFAQTIKNCKHKWLITYDDCDYIRELFSFAEITPWNLTYGMRNVSKKSSSKGNELFISNFEIPIKKTKQLTLFDIKK